jgi:hypothetical protein
MLVSSVVVCLFVALLVGRIIVEVRR